MQSICLEVASAILSLAAVFLDTQQRILARPMSLISIGIGSIVYFSSGLYAKCLLNFIYLLLNSYGWYQWKYGGKNRSGLSVSKVGTRGIIYFILLGSVGTLALGHVLNTQTNADLAYWDAGNTVFCLIAHTLLVRKKLETWLFWFVLDLYFTILCYYKGLYVFSAIHILYLFLGIYGYRSWYQAYLDRLATMPPTSG